MQGSATGRPGFRSWCWIGDQGRQAVEESCPNKGIFDRRRSGWPLGRVTTAFAISRWGGGPNRAPDQIPKKTNSTKKGIGRG